MNLERAEEIMNSQENIKVFYNGNSVWLENIEGGNARIKNFSNWRDRKLPR